ncbi:MAG: hypothetical protein ABL856_01585 [Gallionella sp.]
MEIAEIIDKAKVRANIASDYALAKALGKHTGTVANWRKGKQHPSNEEAVQLATLAGMDEMQVIAEIELRTAKNEKKARILATLFREARSRCDSWIMRVRCSTYRNARRGKRKRFTIEELRRIRPKF